MAYAASLPCASEGTFAPACSDELLPSSCMSFFFKILGNLKILGGWRFEVCVWFERVCVRAWRVRWVKKRKGTTTSTLPHGGASPVLSAWVCMNRETASVCRSLPLSRNIRPFIACISPRTRYVLALALIPASLGPSSILDAFSESNLLPKFLPGHTFVAPRAPPRVVVQLETPSVRVL